jgi:uncharacterized NAD(P)/FAD-binding protein YdhS
LADPAYSDRLSLKERNADDIADAYFADRKAHDPFVWAEYNLQVAEQKKADQHTVPWRYAILRLHETVQDIVPELNDENRKRFDNGLSNVFVDNYAAVPSQSIRRLLALRQAGLIDVLDTGMDYDKSTQNGVTEIEIDGDVYKYKVFIDARGQKPMKAEDLPFPSLRKVMMAHGEDIPDIDENYALVAPDEVSGKIYFGALPYIMHDRPFIQGITASADIGAAIGACSRQTLARKRRACQPSFWN